ncbi:class I SAM-dependent methyltransferase [Echinicola marina]|uniref:O-methyltransferase n=1 Tax=Echinicola marina TaxID=2859768 RepID=UPI001CF714CA|nr:class I SAM-dependent methyltransferase [Echinicola marina]UCS94537.1 class I SAM-dependent methyltransferase [Echinicola marina]
MNDSNILDLPEIYPQIEAKCKEIGFTMPSDKYIGTLLKSLMISKPKGRFLELGTGIGLSLSWMVDGLSEDATLITVDNDFSLSEIAHGYFGADGRVDIVCMDGSKWIREYKGAPFDLIFADAWPGKYSELEETLALVSTGGFYVIDDMNVQPNWPDGHQDNVDKLLAYLESRQDFSICKMNWSTGVVVATKK